MLSMWQQQGRSQESLPFLASDNKDDPPNLTSTTTSRRHPTCCSALTFAVWAQIILILLYAIYFLQHLTYSPHHEAHRPELPLFQDPPATTPHRFLLAANSPFAGAPTSVLDRTWSHLLEGMNIRVSEAELAQRNQTSVTLPDGQGHLAWLEAYHQLHCVVSRRAVNAWSRDMSQRPDATG